MKPGDRVRPLVTFPGLEDRPDGVVVELTEHINPVFVKFPGGFTAYFKAEELAILPADQA